MRTEGFRGVLLPTLIIASLMVPAISLSINLVAGAPDSNTVLTIMSARLPTGKWQAAAIWDGENAYIFGGGYNVPMNEILRYSPSTDTITVMSAALPDAVTDTSAVWSGRYVYVFGGWVAPLHISTKITRYDPSTDSVSIMSATLSTYSMSAIWDGNYAYLFGGYDGYTYYDHILRYDPAQDELTAMNAKLPKGLKWTSAIWDGAYAYIFGGYSSLGFSDQILRYDPASDTLTVMSARLPVGKDWTSAVWTGTYAYIFGGEDEDFSCSNQIVRYDPSLDMITVVAELPSGRIATSAVWDGSNAYIFGGGCGNSPIDEIIRFSEGKNILVYVTEDGSGQYDKTWFDGDLPAILGDHGYSVTVTDRIITPEITSSLLADYDELWILSTNPHSAGCFSNTEIGTILNFREVGNGLLIMADHGWPGMDYAVDANQISVPLGVTFYGVEDHGPTGGSIAPDFENHPLFAGVETIEGSNSDGNMIVNDPVEVVATYQGDSLIAVLDGGSGRVVFDVSFTRLWDAGLNGDGILVGDTPQYVRNIADWLDITPPPQIPATIDIDPDTLNLKSRGRWITCYIELPLGYSVENIDVSTVRLIVDSDNVPAESRPTGIGDHDNDGIADLMVKFSRSAVQALSEIGEVEMTVIGEAAGVPFEGSDVVRIIDFGADTLYQARLGVDLNLDNGIGLALRFHTYAGAYQGENVLWDGGTPAQVVFIGNVPHPEGKPIEEDTLVLTDNEGNVISTIASYMVRRLDLEARFLEIPFEWAMSPPDNRIIVEQEFLDLPYQWAIAPS